MLAQSAILQPGTDYTIKYGSNSVLFPPAADTVKTALGSAVATPPMQIVSVERGLFTTVYTIIFRVNYAISVLALIDYVGTVFQISLGGGAFQDIEGGIDTSTAYPGQKLLAPLFQDSKGVLYGVAGVLVLILLLQYQHKS